MSEHQLDRHPWCRDLSRDEAVRASEDGRKGPLPTLEECIERVTDRRPPEPGGGGNVTGSRTERVTLEVTHDYLPHASAMDWPYMVANYFHRNGESVRVVDNTAERITQALAADRFASAVAEADRLRARVAELESSAPAASGAAGTGWLTAEEREALTWWCGSAQSVDIDQLNAWCAAIRALIARSSPPEVVLPFVDPALARIVYGRDSEWIAALAAAGVKVKEAGK